MKYTEEIQRLIEDTPASGLVMTWESNGDYYDELMMELGKPEYPWGGFN